MMSLQCGSDAQQSTPGTGTPAGLVIAGGLSNIQLLRQRYYRTSTAAPACPQFHSARRGGVKRAVLELDKPDTTHE